MVSRPHLRLHVETDGHDVDAGGLDVDAVCKHTEAVRLVEDETGRVAEEGGRDGAAGNVVDNLGGPVHEQRRVSHRQRTAKQSGACRWGAATVGRVALEALAGRGVQDLRDASGLKPSGLRVRDRVV